MTRYCGINQIKRDTRSIKKEELGFTTEDEYEDWLETLVEEASRFIDSYCERPEDYFTAGGKEVTEYHDGVGVSPPTGMYEFSEEAETWEERVAIIFTKQRPILSVTSIHENKAAIGEADDLQEIKAFRWYEHGEIVFASTAIPAKGTKNIKIVYKTGYSSTPKSIEMACRRLIVNLIHKQISDKTSGFTSYLRPTGINFDMPQVLSSDIKIVLNRYKMSGFGEM